MASEKKQSPSRGAGRPDEFSFLKVFPILALPLVHVIYEAARLGYADEEVAAISGIVFSILDIGPAIFMICMGYGMACGKASPQRLCRQGIQFLLINIVLNLFRYLLPNVLLLMLQKATQGNTVELFLESDIYYFVGFFLLFHALMRKLNVSNWNMLLLSILMITVNWMMNLLHADQIDHPWLAAFVGNFWDVNYTSGFALLTWSFIPAAGLCLGEWLKPKVGEDRTHAMRQVLAWSFVLLVTLLVSLRAFQTSLTDAVISGLVSWNFLYAVILICVALILLSLAHELCRRISGTRFYRFATSLSASIMPFYLLQWVMVRCEMTILGITDFPEEGFGVGWLLISTVVIAAACAFLSRKFGMKIMKPLLKITSPWNSGRFRKR